MFDLSFSLYPIFFSILLLLTAKKLNIKEESFFSSIKLFYLLLFADLLLLPAYIALAISFAILTYPAYILFKTIKN